MALEMRGECEKCQAALPHEATAFICSYECTFCPACAEAMAGSCPNCGGELLSRPRRPAEKFAKNPASTERIYKPEGCRRAA